MQIAITGIDRIRERIDKLANLQEKCAEIAKRLCDVGLPIIQAAHGRHASVYPKEVDGGWAVVADPLSADTAHVLLIVEFGAGDATGIMAGQYDEVPSVVRPGSWSATHARMYSRYGFWVFAGHILHEVEPNPAFYYAYQAMVEALPQIANEVFAA